MRTNIVLDDNLLDKAKIASGSKTKKAAIEAGLKLLININKQQKIRKFKGKLKWDGDLDKMRLEK